MRTDGSEVKREKYFKEQIKYLPSKIKIPIHKKVMRK
jgi:hypothetical protein